MNKKILGAIVILNLILCSLENLNFDNLDKLTYKIIGAAETLALEITQHIKNINNE